MLPPHELAATDAGIAAPLAKVVLLRVSVPMDGAKPAARTCTVGVFAGVGVGATEPTVD